MKLSPKNGWIQVEFALDKKEKAHEKSLVVLPEDYKPSESPYKVVSVVNDPEMGKKGYKHGDTIIVPTHVIREVEIGDNKLHLVERNHILAAVLPE